MEHCQINRGKQEGESARPRSNRWQNAPNTEEHCDTFDEWMCLRSSKDHPERKDNQHREDEDQCIEAETRVDDIEDDFREPLVRDPVFARIRE